MAHHTQVSLDQPAEIISTRLLDAPLALVWRAFTDIEHISNWWGPVGFRTTTHSIDLRTGGVWRHTMHGPDGRDYPNKVTYTEVRPMELLAWAHGDDSGGPPLFHASVRFQALGERTLITLHHVFPSGEARDHNIRSYGAVQGAIDTTDRLASHLLLMPDTLDLVFTRDYDAPRERLWQAWTEPAQLARWWGPRVFRNSVCALDLRVGGRYTITMTGPFPGPGDSDYPVDGEYLEIVPQERLVMTVDCTRNPSWWHDGIKPGRTADERNPAGIMMQTVSFEPLGEARSRLVVRTRAISADVLEALKRMGMREGWNESLGRLGALLQDLPG